MYTLKHYEDDLCEEYFAGYDEGFKLVRQIEDSISNIQWFYHEYKNNETQLIKDLRKEKVKELKSLLKILKEECY